MQHERRLNHFPDERRQDRASDQPDSTERRRILVGGSIALSGAALLTGSRFTWAADPDKEIRIGWITPRSGVLGLFNESDPYMLELIRKSLANGIEVGGEKYKVTIIDRDSQSNPARAAQLAQELITQQNIHLMLASSTPETVNPVSDACEAAGVPSIATNCPLEAFHFGRGGEKGRFKWAFDMSFGIQQFATGYLAQWPQVETNRKVAVMYPNDADGNGFRGALVPLLEKNGYQVIDPGAYTNGTTDFSSQIALFNRERCEIFNEVGMPNDIQIFWRQAAQQNFLRRLKIAQLTKSGFFTSQVEQLGELGYNTCSLTVWAPVFPYKSPLTGQTSEELARGYEQATNRIWDNQQGQTLSVFEVAIHVLKQAANPLDRNAIREAIPTVDTMTIIGRINFKDGGPYPNTATTNMLGAQYVKATAGSRFPLDRIIVDNAADRNVPVQRKPVPYR